jgi:hypothetical protein
MRNQTERAVAKNQMEVKSRTWPQGPPGLDEGAARTQVYDVDDAAGS